MYRYKTIDPLQVPIVSETGLLYSHYKGSLRFLPKNECASPRQNNTVFYTTIIWGLSSKKFKVALTNLELSLLINLKKRKYMNKLLLVKEIYVEAFRDWTYKILNRYFRAFSWFCFALLAIAAYALVYRISTGFAFG